MMSQPLDGGGIAHASSPVAKARFSAAESIKEEIETGQQQAPVSVDDVLAMIEKGQLDAANSEIERLLATDPGNGAVHYAQALLQLRKEDRAGAATAAFFALVHGFDAEKIRINIVEPCKAQTSRHFTAYMCEGALKYAKGKDRKAMRKLRKALRCALERDDKIRVYMSLALLTWDMNRLEAAEGFCGEVLEFDPRNALALFWRSEIRAQLGKIEASLEDEKAATEVLRSEAPKQSLQRLLFSSASPAPKGDLRRWLLESKTRMMAPVRAMLVGDPGTSSIWEYMSDSMFGFGAIFGPSQAGQDAKALADAVMQAVEKEEINQVKDLPRPMRHPFSTHNVMVHKFVVQKIIHSYVKPAVLQLLTEDGAPTSPRIMFKNGDDLRQDAIAQAFFEIFNIIWKQTLGDEFEELLTYQVLPLEGKMGFIEWVDDAQTQQEFEFQKGDPTDWMPSFAASMTAAYCIGAEDRHSRNVLVTKDRRVFQIDYAFLWGQQPAGGIIGTGPPLPLSKHVEYALKSNELETLENLSLVLFRALSVYSDELSALASRFAHVIELPVPTGVNIRNFVKRRLESETVFKRHMDTNRTEGSRMRKEYLALAWNQKQLLPKDFFEYLDRPKAREDPNLMQLATRGEESMDVHVGLKDMWIGLKLMSRKIAKAATKAFTPEKKEEMTTTSRPVVGGTGDASTPISPGTPEVGSEKDYLVSHQNGEIIIQKKEI